MRIIETCPKCGHDLTDLVITTYPPIPQKKCFGCGWEWTGEPEEVVRVPLMKNNSVTDRTVYTDFKHEAWVAALNVLAVEFLVKTNQPDMYAQYCEKLSALTDDELDILHIYLDLNNHITSLGHMLSHSDYDSVKENLFEFLEG